MHLDLSSDRPVYLQIMEKLQLDIVAGVYKSGDRLPSVRKLASMTFVNPNTIQKALTELEHTGLIYTNRTSGRFVTDDTRLLARTKKELVSAEVSAFLKKMEQFCYSREDIVTLIKEL